MTGSTAPAEILTCASCDGPLLPAAVNADQPAPCPRCGAMVEVMVFPAMMRPMTPGSTGERILVDNESSCFYHPTKKAVVPCDQCGRFLCALCDMEMNDRHLCPACVEAGAAKGKMTELEVERTRYDSLALTIAVLSFVPPLWYFIIFTAPVVLFLCLWHWRTPLSVIRVRRWRYVVAGSLALMQLALVGLLIALLVLGATQS